MPSITRKLLERTENVRILYALHQEVLRDLVKSGAPLEPGCEMVFDKAALDVTIPTFTIDLSKFGPKWVHAMKTLLLFPAIGNRQERLQLFRGLLAEFYVTASAALLAHTRNMARVDNWQCAQTFFTRSALLRVGVWSLRLAGWMFWARLPQAADVAERGVNMLQEFLTAMRPIATVVPIR
jgi:hypothetical protein